jgi:hypothetical protein
MRANLFALALLASLFISFAFCSQTQPGEATRTLVLLDNYAYFATHSRFLSELQSIYSKVDVRMLNSPDYTIKEFGEYNYENLVLLCTSETGKNFCLKTLIFFQMRVIKQI